MKKDFFSRKALIVAALIAGLGMTGLLWWHTSSAQVPPGGLSARGPASPQTYTNAALRYSLTYPADFTVHAVYPHTASGPDELVPDTAFRIPVSMVAGTNLLSDSHISVEWLAGKGECSALAFLHDMTATSTKTVTDSGVAYTYADVAKEETGNTYEEQVYAFTRVPTAASPCIAFHYYIHSIDIDHYAPGTAHEFDKGALVSAFDSVRRSFTAAR